MQKFALELSCVSGVTWSSRSIRSGLAEFNIYSLLGTISSAISHYRRINYADVLVNRSRTARSAQLRDSRLANFAVGRLCTHCNHCAVHLVRKRKEKKRGIDTKIKKSSKCLKRLKIFKSLKYYIYKICDIKYKRISSPIILYITGLYRNRRDGCWLEENQQKPIWRLKESQYITIAALDCEERRIFLCKKHA